MLIGLCEVFAIDVHSSLKIIRVPGLAITRFTNILKHKHSICMGKENERTVTSSFSWGASQWITFVENI